MVLVQGCAHDAVTIHYEQIGACNGIATGPGATSAGPNAAYAILRINSIDNKESSARDFNFDPNLLFVNLTPRAYTSAHLNLVQLNPFYAVSATIKAGNSLSMNGAVVAVVQTSATDGASEASKTSYFLSYDSPSATQPIILDKVNSSQTTWPYIPDCSLITY
jgi:hypothetical protein